METTMDSALIGFYVTLLIIGLLFAYGGYESTMRLFSYVDLNIRYTWIKIQMFFMKRKLEKQLDIARSSFKKEIEELANGK
jgi:hypothetical protein